MGWVRKVYIRFWGDFFMIPVEECRTLRREGDFLVVGAREFGSKRRFCEMYIFYPYSDDVSREGSWFFIRNYADLSSEVILIEKGGGMV